MIILNNCIDCGRVPELIPVEQGKHFHPKCKCGKEIYSDFKTWSQEVAADMWNGMHQGTFGGNVKLNEQRIHPTQKPVKLYDWLLANYAKPGDKILDTHLGSGSSAIAAHYAGFEFVGTELDADYFKAAKYRFNRETAQIAMQL
jgi:DNA modification methylase